jgi:hypothetical protein
VPDKAGDWAGGFVKARAALNSQFG